MKKALFYLSIILLFALTPFCFIGILNTGVSLKYEVDHPRIFIGINDKTNKIEKEAQQSEIDKHENKLKITYYIFAIGLFALPISASTLLIYRTRLTKTINKK